MNRLTLCLLLAATLLAPCCADSQNLVRLTGTLTGVPSVRMVVFQYQAEYAVCRDTVPVVNNRYDFCIAAEEPVNALVTFRSNVPIRKWHGQELKYYTFPVYLQPGNMQLITTDSVQHTAVTGSQAHLDNLEYMALEKPYKDSILGGSARSVQARMKNDTAAEREADKAIDSFKNLQMTKVVLPFVASHPSSPLALNLLGLYLKEERDPARAKEVFETLPAETRASPRAKGLLKMIDRQLQTAVGRTAADFAQKDISGREVRLSRFRGKWVLVDFWASWCMPCRGENPNVVRAFKKLAGPRFTVLGISLDDEKEPWLKAIRKDGLTWTQLSDLKGWSNEVAQLYSVNSIPANFLIDPQGRIVAMDLRGEDLVEKLQSYIGK